MGGDAFSNTLRLTEEEYQRICQIIKSVFDDNIDARHNRIGFPVEVKNKEELCQTMGKGNPYGDVDVIIGMDNDVEKLKLINLLKVSLGVTDETYTKKFKECSILTQERYQVDLLFCPLESFDFLLAFKGNNDFGALLGHLLTPFCLKWNDKGLMLKLKIEGVSNVGTLRDDFLLSNDLENVCDFISVPKTCLDGKTRMTTSEIFDILTTCKFFTNNSNYDQKYKIKERRKRRPVADTFFSLLEAEEQKENGETLENKNHIRFQNDHVYKILLDFRNDVIDYEKYIEEISNHFGSKSKMMEKLAEMKKHSTDLSESESKFNFYILKSWYPNVEQAKIGKIFAKLKSSKSGNGKQSYEKWILETDIVNIRESVQEIFDKL